MSPKISAVVCVPLTISFFTCSAMQCRRHGVRDWYHAACVANACTWSSWKRCVFANLSLTTAHVFDVSVMPMAFILVTSTGGNCRPRPLGALPICYHPSLHTRHRLDLASQLLRGVDRCRINRGMPSQLRGYLNRYAVYQGLAYKGVAHPVG